MKKSTLIISAIFYFYPGSASGSCKLGRCKKKTHYNNFTHSFRLNTLNSVQPECKELFIITLQVSQEESTAGRETMQEYPKLRDMDSMLKKAVNEDRYST